MVSYNWDDEFKIFNVNTLAFSALRSCIEADEPYSLSDVLNKNRNAYIYALILCFTSMPSVKCIEYLIANGTPLGETFEANPYKCTPQQYLDLHFNDTTKMYIRARAQIYNAIEKGKLAAKNKEQTTISVNFTSSSNSQVTVRNFEKEHSRPLIFRIANSLSNVINRN